ncbi:hypothetical protein B0H19DRAFT_1097341 [Mycena capillaripes]|nr:hypothetical protein B0H19DRAFT_1097341 [Mycena capillaripes]
MLLGFTWATAVLATTQMALRLTTSVMNVRILLQVIEQQPSSIGVLEGLRLTQFVVLAINNLVTDGLLLYRCHMMWGK